MLLCPLYFLSIGNWVYSLGQIWVCIPGKTVKGAVCFHQEVETYMAVSLCNISRDDDQCLDPLIQQGGFLF